MSDEISFANLRARLEETMDWPHEYVFKFIVRAEFCRALREVFAGENVSGRYSRGGNYFSLTVVRNVNSSEEVVAVYEKARAVPGVIML